MQRQLRNKGGVMTVKTIRKKYGLGSDLKDFVRKIIPNELADVAVKAAPFVAPFNPLAAAAMRGIGRFDQRGSISDALKQGALTYAGGRGVRYLGGAEGASGGLDSFSMDKFREGPIGRLFKSDPSKVINKVDEVALTKGKNEGLKGLAKKVIKKLPEGVAAQLVAGGLTAGASLLASYFQGEFREQEPGETMEDYLAARKEAVGSQMRTYMDNYFKFDKDYSTMTDAQRDAFVARYNVRDGGIIRLGFDNGGTPVFTKGSILKDKDVMRMFEDADQIKSTLSAFIEEERAPNVSEIMDTMKFFEKVGKRYDKTGEKIASREDFEEIDPYGTFVRDEKGFLKRDEEGNFITDKSKINPRRREPVEILMGELIMKKKEKEIDELDKKLIKMLKDKGLLEKFYEDQNTAFRIMDLTEKYKDKQLAKQADADSMLSAFGYGEIKKANGGIARLSFSNGTKKPRAYEVLIDKEGLAKEAEERADRINKLAEKISKEKGISFDEALDEAISKIAPGTFSNDGKTNIDGSPKMKKGGLMKIPVRTNSEGIKELDMRKTGGFVPIGVKEKADDVPAMLSKNEFVMTADAVRAAGGGSINKGAQRMYDTMKKLEGMVA